MRLPTALARFDCRNNRLAALALRSDGFDAHVRSAAARHGAQRVGVLVGTSTSGILQTEIAYRERAADGALPAWLHYAETHDTASLARYRAGRARARGPGVGDLHRLFVGRQGLRRGGALDRARRRSTPRWSAASTRCA